MRFPFFRSKDKAPAPSARPAMGGDDAQVQTARTRARRRLVGALVLLVAGVVGFPLLFETQPRPLLVDTPILVPEGTPGTSGTRSAPARATAAQAAAARPLPALPPDAGTESAVTPVQLGGPAAASAPVQTAKAQPAPAPAPRAEPASAPAPKPAPVAKPVTPPPPLVVSVPAKPVAEPAPAASAAAGRFVVQVGAYNDIEKLKAARGKLEKMGYKSYTQDVDSPTGKRTRVRVGPYGSKQEADAVAVKLKAAGMQTAILSL